ncbi:MAG: BrnA antitoxin family protein [Anaerolineae bacterium]
MDKMIKLPKFDNEDEEREFWANADLNEYFDAGDFENVSFPNLKPTSRPISIRFPEYVLDAVKEKANKMGVPYQALIKEAVMNAHVTSPKP